MTERNIPEEMMDCYQFGTVGAAAPASDTAELIERLTRHCPSSTRADMETMLEAADALAAQQAQIEKLVEALVQACDDLEALKEISDADSYHLVWSTANDGLISVNAALAELEKPDATCHDR